MTQRDSVMSDACIQIHLVRESRAKRRDGVNGTVCVPWRMHACISGDADESVECWEE